ncbi:TonB-dependent receptor [Novosphingobium sp. SG720]|uniref:TonB-dependent receptor n=1 Tax=Novosphingobium sp. SG720 TaxID=2586998 RepID=UPI0014450FCB|nr:TonB-dependent receptor [Novosphingobium sp. SG720]NKJ44464.1 outer membrane receptor protein involved in Fe transport [Novosphingobium sp. SG720]
MSKAILAVSGLITAHVLLAGTAFAADGAQPAPAVPAEETPSTGNDIVVTALHRTSTVQTTPLSIVAISGDGLAKTGATQLNDYFRQIPNLNVTSGVAGSNRISIRGVNAAGEATVGLYYDETPVTGPSGTTQDSGAVAADLNLFDVERVEVLRGPQGTLYGASSMAGTLRVIFHKPDYDKVEAGGETQVTTTEGGSAGYFLRGMVNLPVVTDKLAVRVVGYGERKPGWIDNVTYGTQNINRSSNWGARGIIGFKPDELTTITATASYQKSDARDQQGWYPSVGRYKTNSTAQLPFHTEMQLYNLKADRDLGFATLTGTASYYNYNYIRTVDFTPSVAAYANSTAQCARAQGGTACTTDQFAAYRATGLALLPAVGYQPAWVHSQNYEARLASNAAQMPAWLEWTVGVYYEKRNDHIDSNVISESAADGSITLPITPLVYRYVETRSRQVAGFGEVSIKPLPGLTITGGLRYYDYSKTTSGQSYITNYYTGTSAAPYSAATTKANGWLEKFNVNYRITPRVMVYASASKGFRPGGANNIPGLAANLVSYKPDSLWNYEVGLKSSWLGDKLVLNGAVFDVEWSNMQSSARTADGLYAFLTNAGHARIRGLEVDLTTRPLRGLTLNGALGYVDAHLTQDQSSSAVLITASTGKAGDPIPNTPDLTASASASYSWALNSRFDGLVRADGAYTGHQEGTFRPTDPYHTSYGNYATANLRVGVENPQMGIYVFCNNLTDTTGAIAVSSGYGYSNLTYSIQPRTWGLNARFSL